MIELVKGETLRMSFSLHGSIKMILLIVFLMFSFIILLKGICEYQWRKKLICFLNEREYKLLKDISFPEKY